MTTTRPGRPAHSDLFFQRVVSVVGKIPRGKVATYGQVAVLAGKPRAARQIAWVLKAASHNRKLPWQRVVSHKGTISLSKYGGYDLQRALLLHEGVRFDSDDRIDLEKYRWRPRHRSPPARKYVQTRSEADDS